MLTGMSQIPVRSDNIGCQRKNHSPDLGSMGPQHPVHNLMVAPLLLVQLAHEASKEAQLEKHCRRQLCVHLQVMLTLAAPWIALSVQHAAHLVEHAASHVLP